MSKGEYWGETMASISGHGCLLTLCRYRPNAKFPRHAHEFPGLYFLVSGDHFELNSRSRLEQAPLTGIWHDRDAQHETYVGPRGMLGLNVTLIEPCPSFEIDPSAGIRPVVDGPDVAYAGLRLSIAIRRGESANVIADRSWELLSYVADGRDESLRWLANVRRSVMERFRESVSLNKLAAEAGVHPVYLARCYRRQFGRSISQHLHELRLGWAMKLAEQGSSFGDAAHAAGFCDQAHFSRICRRFLGSCPKSIRMSL